MTRYSAGYSQTQVFLHWTITILVLAVFFAHEEFLAAQDILRNGSALTTYQRVQIDLHTWGGTLVLPLALWRLFLRARVGVPAPPARESRTLRAVASGVHMVLYGLIFLLPISGILSYYAVLPMVSTFVHEVGEPALFILVVVHAGATLMHHFVWKTDVLRRMLNSTNSSQN